MNIDQVKLQEYFDAVCNNVNQFTDITNKVVEENCQDLDALMSDLKIALTQEQAASTDTLERYYAELTNLLYFMADRLERLGVFKDLGGATAKEAYNKAYLAFASEKDERGKSIRTVNENSALAETETQYQSIVGTVYANAYGAVKLKVDLAQEMVSTLKNILRKRINENYLNAQLSGMRGGMGDLRSSELDE